MSGASRAAGHTMPVPARHHRALAVQLAIEALLRPWVLWIRQAARDLTVGPVGAGIVIPAHHDRPQRSTRPPRRAVPVPMRSCRSWGCRTQSRRGARRERGGAWRLPGAAVGGQPLTTAFCLYKGAWVITRADHLEYWDPPARWVTDKGVFDKLKAEIANRSAEVG